MHIGPSSPWKAGCAALPVFPSYILFAPFQDKPFVVIALACNLLGDMTKNLEVVVVERGDEEEHCHFVGSHKLEQVRSESPA